MSNIVDNNEELIDKSENTDDFQGDEAPLHNSTYKVPSLNDESNKHHLSGMYQTWFLDYASYVNLERAIPHINDGLKPVQRRVLHSMRRMNDGRYNKVANIVGHTMQFHPHGDSSIYDALVTIGQKNILVDCQGNWGNIMTGDPAAAARYIEARLSKFALDTVFNPKTTEWKLSYDGRNKEPIYLPVKFPLLLAQGTEGIGLGLNSKILPHNFNELIDASIAYLKGEEFTLYPDFPTGGAIDINKYNDGERGGKIKIRAHIEKIDTKTLAITDIPYGITSGKLMESIIKANEKGKINIKKVEDMTSDKVEILIHLEAKTSSDKTIDALYAFTNCEVNYSPNCCVIQDNKPLFTNVSYILKHSAEVTKNLLKLELEIQRGELLEQLHYASLEKIFIEERIYKDKEFEEATSNELALAHIDKRLTPFKKDFICEVTTDDLQHLLEIKMARILRFNSDKAQENIIALRKQIKECEAHIAQIVQYTIDWFKYLKEKYGAPYKRLTEIKNFETIEAAKVVEANEKLYINREEGFIGTGLKKDEFVCNCSDMDDVIIFYKDGKYKVVRISEKLFVGKNIIHLDIFKKNDKRTTYNVVYRNGRIGAFYMKRFAVNGVTRDKEYDLTQGEPNSKVYYFSANPNGEAETIKVTLKPTTRRIKNLVFEKDFSELAIKGRQSMGNILTKFDVQKISLKERGSSTLGGTPIWFDPDILRLNFDKRGTYLGEFSPNEEILVICKNGDYYTTSFELENHYDEDILRIEKFNPHKTWTVALFDADQQNLPYLKRFQLESSKKRVSMLGNNLSKMILITDTAYPRLEVVFGGDSSFRENLIIDAEEFIGVKSMKAKGKRITLWAIDKINELEPTKFPQQEENNKEDEPQQPLTTETDTADKNSTKNTQNEILNVDENTGQINLF